MIRFADENMRVNKFVPCIRHESYFEREEFIKNQINNILTSPSNLRRLIFFDARGAETNLKDKSLNVQNATLSLAGRSLDPDIEGRLKILNFNASGDFWDFNDSDDLSFGDGATDTPFSIIACMKLNVLNTENGICSKVDFTGGNVKAEYLFELSPANQLNLFIYSGSQSGVRIARYTSGGYSDNDNFHTYIVTYSGNKSSSGIKIYRDGIRVDDSDLNAGSYVAMSNTTQKVGGYYLSSGTKGGLSNSKYALSAIIAEELSQSQVTNIDVLIRRYMGVI